MNRRGFVSAALAGVGGLFFPQKLFAWADGCLSNEADGCLSNEEVLYRILEKSQDYVCVIVNSPIYCRGFKKKVNCLALDNLYCLSNNSEFGFNDEHWQTIIPIDNIQSISVTFQDNTTMFCYFDDDDGHWRTHSWSLEST